MRPDMANQFVENGRRRTVHEGVLRQSASIGAVTSQEDDGDPSEAVSYTLRKAAAARRAAMDAVLRPPNSPRHSMRAWNWSAGAPDCPTPNSPAASPPATNP